jgi:shikimate kinase/shikimate kinase/3-dehydroquinate synthase
MKSKENIVFLGMMGSGKTSIGQLISKKLNLKFVDIDHLIEEELSMSISEIFTIKGEKFFRDFEEKITLKILKKKEVVVSLGGGAFLNKKIRTEILNNHLSIWLKLDIKTLIKRIRGSSKRPIAFKSSNDELINLIKNRSHIYSKALYKINCNNLKKYEIVNKVLEKI